MAPLGAGGLTPGLEDAGCILRGTDGPEVSGRSRVMAHRGLGTLVLQAGAGHPLIRQVIQLLHPISAGPGSLGTREEGDLRHLALSREGQGA